MTDEKIKSALNAEESEENEETAVNTSAEEYGENNDGNLFEIKAKSVIEAILFAAGYPVKYEKLASVLEVPVSQVKKIVKKYADEYNSTENGLPRGILMLTYEDACQLCTKEEYGLYIREALGIRKGGNLSASSIEVLAIIAYNEPVTRAFVDTVRGVDSSYAVTSLADKHLIEPCGRLDVPGRPILYRTTDDFLRVFGMQSLTDLPEISITPNDERQQSLPIDELNENSTGDSDETPDAPEINAEEDTTEE